MSAPSRPRCGFQLSPLSLALAMLALGAGLAAPAHAQTAAPDTAAAARPDNAAALPAVSVDATIDDDSAQHLNAPVHGGALGRRSQVETPFSTTVVTSGDIENNLVTKLGDVFAADASVSDNSAAYGAWASYLTVRGLPLDWQNSFRIDGNPFLSYVTTLPYEQFEQIELLKGASGFMYGFGSPGGLVNYITKRPTDTPVRSVDVGYASKGLFTEHVDLGGRGGQDDRFGYRLNATHESGNTYNGGSLNRNSVSLALDARLTDRLTWDFQTLQQDRKVVGQEPTIYVGQMTGLQLPAPVRNDNQTLVGDGVHVDNRFRYYATGLKYRLAQDWTLSATYSHSSTKTRRNESVLYLADSQGDYDDYHSDYAEAYQFDQAQVMVEGKFATGAIKHQVVAGASWQEQKNDYSSGGFWGLTGTGSLYSQNTNAYFGQGSLDLYRAADITQKALFASDTVTLTDRWSVLAGLRYTNYSQTGFDPGGTVSSSYGKNGVTTPTVALMYKLAPQAMAYASYMEALEPGTVVGQTYGNKGALLDPLKSRQYEVGAKIERAGWAATAALFRIERKAQYDNGDNILVQDGLSVYQGLELGASKRLGRDLTVGGSLMLLDSEYKKGAANLGNQVAGAPEVVAAAQVAYSVPQLPGLTLRARVKYTGRTMVNAANTVTAAGYALVDLGATYDTRIRGYDTTFRLALNNLADKRYWLYQSDSYIKAGDPRAISLGATLRF